jgi:hypothetical protein
LVAATGGAILALWANAASAAVADDVLALGRTFVDVGNAGDMNRLAAQVDDGDHQIIDNFPPFVWNGPNGYKAWTAAYFQYVAANKITDGRSAFGDPIYVRIDNDLAFVCVHETYTYKRAGSPVREDLIWTYVAHKTASGWKLGSWTYSGGPTP